MVRRVLIVGHQFVLQVRDAAVDQLLRSFRICLVRNVAACAQRRLDLASVHVADVFGRHIGAAFRLGDVLDGTKHVPFVRADSVFSEHLGKVRVEFIESDVGAAAELMRQHFADRRLRVVEHVMDARVLHEYVRHRTDAAGENVVRLPAGENVTGEPGAVGSEIRHQRLTLRRAFAARKRLDHVADGLEPRHAMVNKLRRNRRPDRGEVGQADAAEASHRLHGARRGADLRPHLT